MGKQGKLSVLKEYIPLTEGKLGGKWVNKVN